MAVDGNLKTRFEASALPWMRRVYAAALYQTENRADADDLMQETYLRAYRFFDQFVAGTNVKAWLLAILRNVLRNQFRHRAVEQRCLGMDAVAETYERIAASFEACGSAGDALMERLVEGPVGRALVNLPRDFRTAVLLVHVYELSYAEAAAAVGCPLGTIRSRLARARRLLQASLHDYAREHGLIGAS